MLNRRGFLGAGLAGCALPWLGAAASSAQAVPVAPLPLYRVVVDRRFQAATGFGDSVAARGAVVRAIRGDVTELWFYELAPRWRERPVPIAGLTGAEALFCLERLAWDAGLRVAYRGEHRPVGDAALRHRLSGSACALAPAVSLAPGQGDWGHDWAARVAELVLACPRQAPSQLASMTVSGPQGSPALSVPLYSWVIAERAAREPRRTHRVLA